MPLFLPDVGPAEQVRDAQLMDGVQKIGLCFCKSVAISSVLVYHKIRHLSQYCMVFSDSMIPQMGVFLFVKYKQNHQNQLKNPEFPGRYPTFCKWEV